MPNPLSKYRSMPGPAKAALWFLACGVLQRGVSVITTPVFTRLLTTAEYGQWTLFNSWLDILGVLVTLRLSYGVFMQGLVRYDHDADAYTSSLAGLTSLLTLAGLLVYWPLRDFWNGLTGLNTFLTLCALAAAWATAMFGFWSGRQRVKYSYRALVAVTLAVSVTTPAAGVLAVLSTEACKVEARVAAVTLVEVAVYGSMFAYYMAKGRRPFDRGHWGHALRFNLPLVPHYLSQSLLNQADRVMVNAMVGASAAGVYGLAYSLSWVMSVVNQALLNTLNPWIYQHIRAGDAAGIARTSYAALVAVAGANLLLVAAAPEVVALFAPAEYASAAGAVPPLAASVVVTFLYSLFADFEFYFERTGWVAAASVVGAAVNVGLNALLIPRLGWEAAAWTTLASYLVYVGMHYAFMRRVQKAEMGGARVYDPRALAVILAAFGAAAALLAALYPYPAARYAVIAAALVIAFIKRGRIADAWRKVRGN